VAATFDGQFVRLYLNGNMVRETKFSGFAPPIDQSNEVPVWMGASPPDPSSRPFRGTMSDLRLYDRALSSQDISSLVCRGTR